MLIFGFKCDSQMKSSLSVISSALIQELDEMWKKSHFYWNELCIIIPVEVFY